jgi:two-component system chemotaxis response regulator CheY
MMPEMDGYAALEGIRAREEAVGIRSSLGSKIIVVSALDQMKRVMKAFRGLCDAYLFKPLDRQKLLEHLHSFGLIDQTAIAPASIEA